MKASRVSSTITAAGGAAFLPGRAVERYHLQNGLQIMLLRDPDVPVVSYQTWFRVGARFDPQGRSGIAHLFEHMMFKATTNLPEGAFSRILEEAGARDLNAWTWYDQTVYMQSVPRQYLELVVQLESDRMVNLLLNDQQLTSERKVVLNERQLRSEDDPFGKINEVLGNLAFDHHPYKRPVIGWREDIEAIDLDDCMAFYRSFYAPNNAILIIAGDIDRDETLALVERYYGGISAQTVRFPELPVEPAPTGLRQERLSLQVETDLALVGVRVPGTAHVDRPALMLLDMILAHGNSSRLERRLVDSGICSSADSFLPPFMDPGLFEIQLNLREGHAAAEATDILFHEFERLARDGVTQAELERARIRARVAMYQELRDNASRSQFVGMNELLLGSFEKGVAFIESLSSVTLDEVHAAAKTYLLPEASTVIVGHPSAISVDLHASLEEDENEDEEEEETLSESAETDGTPIEDEETVKIGEARAEGRLKPFGAHLKPLIPGTPWTVQQSPLPHQGLLVLVEDHTLPLINLEIVFPGGQALEPELLEGLADFSGAMLSRGTTSRTREAFEEALEDIGASLDVGADVDQLSLSATVLSDHWPALLELLLDAVGSPALAETELEQLRGETLASLVEARTDDKTLVDQWFSRLLFPNHPYGRTTQGTAEAVRKFGREDVVGFLRRALTREGVTVGLAGDIDLASAMAAARRLLDVLPGGEPVVKLAEPAPQPPGRRVYLIDKPERTQTQIMVGHHGLPAAHPDSVLLTLGMLAFGGNAFTTRLMQEVREKRGWSYGAYARFEPLRDGGLFSAWVIPVVSDAPACLRLVLDLYTELANLGITEEELAYARKSLLNGAAFDEDTPAHCLRGVLRRLWLGTRRDINLKRIAEASLDEVNAAIARWCVPDSLTIAIVCTALDLRPELAALTDLTVVDTIPYDRS